MLNVAPLHVLAVIIAFGSWQFASPADAEPYRPVARDQVLQHLPAIRDASLKALAAQRAKLTEDPGNLELAVPLALHYAELGRSKADPRYEGYARAALAPWWTLKEPPVQVRLLRANLRQRRHDFAAALTDIESVLRDEPQHPQAWLSKAMIHAVQGEVDDAAHACSRLSDETLKLAVRGCRGHIGRLTGNALRSYRGLSESLAQHGDRAPKLRLWLLTIMAEIAVQLNQAENADWQFQKAMSVDDEDPYLLAAYSDFLLDQDRPGDVVDLLEDHERIDPLLLRLAIAETTLKHADADRHIDLLQRRFNAAARRFDSVHLREQSRFTLEILDRPAEALDLALRNWSTQRERADARLVLEAALASKKAGAAKPVLDWITSTGIEDATLLSLSTRIEGLVL